MYCNVKDALLAIDGSCLLLTYFTEGWNFLLKGNYGLEITLKLYMEAAMGSNCQRELGV